MGKKYLFVQGKEGKILINTQAKAKNIKETFTDFLAFYNENDDLIAIIPKSEIVIIIAMERME